MKTKIDKKFKEAIHHHVNDYRTLCMEPGKAVRRLPKSVMMTLVASSITCEKCLDKLAT